MSTSTTVRQRPLDEQARDGAKSGPMLAGVKSSAEVFLVKLFAIVPAVALATAVPLVWGWGLGWADIGLAVFFSTVTCLGVTIGFHRYFTRGAFTANRGLRVGLAVIGSTAPDH